ncbi:hypothetical protein LOAG_15482 [Loa loa]|uniref:Uncharacterized protein n=1 Tax=Loa loa TaxID=7209 RepID=A0A1S0TGX1_LOALO|nr:hypothetical protein LOAG_15482 [Loa loa]EFO13047.1 hypothetical protein LOAG_15482 [Loa loa]
MSFDNKFPAAYDGKSLISDLDPNEEIDLENVKFQYIFDSLRNELKQQVNVVSRRNCQFVIANRMVIIQ